MIQLFKNTGTEDIFNGINSKAARAICPQTLWRVATRKLDQIDSVTTLNELRMPPAIGSNYSQVIDLDSIAFA